jgi:plastocyanin
MIWPWVISFNRSIGAVIISCPLLAALAWSATVSGHTQMAGSKDSAAKQKSDYSGIVVWLTSPDETLAPPPRVHAQMLQKDKHFIPHIMVIETGTNVDFPNLDPMFHNAFSNYDGKIFDIALYPPGSSKTVTFDRPGIVRVFCNIHPSMSAIIVVVDSNHFAVTDAEGLYSMSHVDPGRYAIHFFHERATPEDLAKLTHYITVEGDGPVMLTKTTVSEARYLPVAHKNKYGQDYPTDADTVDNYSLHLK